MQRLTIKAEIKLRDDLAHLRSLNKELVEALEFVTQQFEIVLSGKKCVAADESICGAKSAIQKAKTQS